MSIAASISPGFSKLYFFLKVTNVSALNCNIGSGFIDCILVYAVALTHERRLMQKALTFIYEGMVFFLISYYYKCYDLSAF